MPYPNEHAARQRDPGLFERIVQIWPDEKEPNYPYNSQWIRALGGPLKTNPGGGTVVQAIRFEADKWTPDRAKSWLKEHDYKTTLEAASGQRSEDLESGEIRRCFRPAEELRVLAVEGQPTRIVGLAVPYNAQSEDLGGFRELVEPGAFGESLRGGRDLRADVEHDAEKLLARSSKGTLRFEEDARGLVAEITLPDTSLARDVVADIKAGNRDAMSVSFLRKGLVAEFARSAEGVIRRIKEAVLTGVTITAYPAYVQTAGTLDLRSLESWRTDQAAAEADRKQAEEEAARQAEEEAAGRKRRLELAAEEPYWPDSLV